MNFFESYFRAAENLNDKDRLAFYDQLFRTFFDGREVELTGSVAAVWECVKPTLKKTKALSEAGRRGGSKSRKPNVSQVEAIDKPDVSQSEASRKPQVSQGEASRKPRVTEKEKEKDNNPPLSPQGDKKVTATQMIEERGMPKDLEDAAKVWVQYKAEKGQKYKPTGLKSLLTEILNNAEQHGNEAVIDVMNKSMAAGYMGITWDWLRKPVARSGTKDDLDKWLAERRANEG